MRRLLLALVVTALAPGLASARPDAFRYLSPHTQLSYSYHTDTGRPDGRVVGYAIPMAKLDLVGTISADDTDYRLTLRLDSDSTAEIRVGYSSVAGFRLDEMALDLSWESGTLAFVGDPEAGRLTQVTGVKLDCAALLNQEIFQTVAAALQLVQADLAKFEEPPVHLGGIAAALYFAGTLPVLAGRCEAVFAEKAGSCYHDNRTFDTCVGCCERGSAIAGAVCSFLGRFICASAVCRNARALGCNGFRAFADSTCIGHNCLGKPGDPGCNENLPCQGACIAFCGPGWSAGCGDCSASASQQTECCVP